MKLPSACRRTREGLTEYLDDALSPGRRQGMEAHLAACGECRRFLEEMLEVMEAARRLPREVMPEEMRARLLGRLRGG